MRERGPERRKPRRRDRKDHAEAEARVEAAAGPISRSEAAARIGLPDPDAEARAAEERRHEIIGASAVVIVIGPLLAGAYWRWASWTFEILG